MSKNRAIKASRRPARRTKIRRKRVPRKEGLKLRKLSVRNFKAFGELRLDFPAPRFEDEPDVFVMGSQNGLGKTSVLEACSLLAMAAIMGERPFKRIRRYANTAVDVSDLMVRGGAQEAELEGTLAYGGKKTRVSLRLHRSGQIKAERNMAAFRGLATAHMTEQYEPDEIAERLLFSLAGLDAEPVLLPSFMYFHSYRKVPEGNPELGMMVEPEAYLLRRRRLLRRHELPTSVFKLQMLRLMMSRGGLFEGLVDAQAENELATLNNLVREYARGHIEKLRPSPDNTIEFRITPVADGPSFPFDSLSSGQKEIISTMFLIWHHTRVRPGIVLIDEPELHLNAEWRRGFVKRLHKLVPENQYIIATHSEDIFGSVGKDRRILLQPS